MALTSPELRLGFPRHDKGSAVTRQPPHGCWWCAAQSPELPFGQQVQLAAMPIWETGHKSNTSMTQYTELDFSILLKEKQNPSKAVRVRVQGTGMKAMRFRSPGIQRFPCHLGYSFCGFSCIFLPATSPLPFIALSFWLPRAFVNHTLLNVNFHTGTRG